MNHTRIKNGDPNFSLECLGTSRGIRWLLVSISVLFFAVGCSSNQSKSPPPNPVANRANDKDPTPSKTSTSERTSRDKDKDGDDTSEEPIRRRTKPDTKNSPKPDPRPKAPALDPALAAMTCDAPPIRGDAKRLISYLKDPTPPGGRRLSEGDYQKALEATKDIDPDDPSSLKTLQDQLDAVCKK